MTNQIVAKILEATKEKALASLAPGHVYAAENADRSLVKIGRSRQPKFRLRTISSTAGGLGRVYVSPTVLDSVAVESALHAHFSEYRTTGEWFSVSFGDVSGALRSVCAELEATQEDIARVAAAKADKAERVMRVVSSMFFAPQVSAAPDQYAAELELDDLNRAPLQQIEAYVKATLGGSTHEDLLRLAHKLAYQLVYARRAAAGEALPTSVDDPVFAELQKSAWIEIHYADC